MIIIVLREHSRCLKNKQFDGCQTEVRSLILFPFFGLIFTVTIWESKFTEVKVIEAVEKGDGEGCEGSKNVFWITEDVESKMMAEKKLC